MEVILSNFKNHPSCPHGPCLLFERHRSTGLKTGRRFFACSACRNRSECSFFQWADDEMSEGSKTIWEKLKEEKRAPYSHEECVKRLNIFKSLPNEKRKYCRTCSLLILDQPEKHSSHDVIGSVSIEQLSKPSSLLEIRQNKKTEAQYFFSKTTVDFLISLIKDLRYSKLVLIGVPTIHEFVVNNQDMGLSSHLMDIDHRYMQFFTPEQFCHYNMFNNYFFDNKKSKRHFKDFLSEKKDKKVLVILDPPFGGLVNTISHTLKNINNWWQRQNNKTEEFIPFMWIFPYFHEGRILKNLPDAKMMDYKVEYENHKKFGKLKAKNSPVRIFTNIDASHFTLPEQGYRFCDKCKRYVSEENKHCEKCKECTTKHGKTYHHCDDCQQCVKSSYIHCRECKKCYLPFSLKNICQNCELKMAQNGRDATKRICPGVVLSHVKRRKKE